MIKVKLFFQNHLISEYKKGFVYIFSSKILIAGVGFLVTPILSRLFTPAEYGFFALMNSMTMVMALLSNLTLPTCLLTTDENFITKAAVGIIEYSLFVNLAFVTFGVFMVVSFSDMEFVQKLSLSIQVVVLMSLSSFLITITQVLASLNIRNKEFKKNVAVNLTENFTTRISSISLGFLGFTKFGLFFSDIVGKSANVVLQSYFKKFDFRTYTKEMFRSLDNFKALIRTHKEYPVFNLPASLISSFSSQLILWVLALSFSGASVGYFTMAIGLLSIPLLLLTNSFQPLITSKFFHELKQFPHRLFLRLSLILFVISTVCYLFIYLVAPFFIKIYLGDTWLPSINLVQILCIPFALQLLGGSLSGAFVVFNMQRANFTIKLMFLLILLIGFYILSKTGVEITTMVILYGIVVSLEEVLKIIYVALRLKYVRSS